MCRPFFRRNAVRKPKLGPQKRLFRGSRGVHTLKYPLPFSVISVPLCVFSVHSPAVNACVFFLLVCIQSFIFLVTCHVEYLSTARMVFWHHRHSRLRCYFKWYSHISSCFHFYELWRGSGEGSQSKYADVSYESHKTSIFGMSYYISQNCLV